jgi:multidrug resistance protein, MATE family
MPLGLFRDSKVIRKEMFKMAIPIAISGLVTQAQMLIDTAFLGHYSIKLPDGSFLTGKDFLSAVGNVFFPYIVTLSFMWMITTGTIVLVSQRLGAKEPEKAKEYAEASIKFNGLLSIAIYIVWQLVAPSVFSLMGVKEPILAISLDYIRTMSLELIPMGIAVSLGAAFQGMGITRFEMQAGILRSAVNAVLDWIMIYGRFGFPEMGAAGAGLATAISGYVANAYFIFAALRCRDAAFRPSVRGILKAPFADYREVFKLGLPTGIEGMLWNGGNLIMAGMLNVLSQDAVGIYRLVMQIELTPVFFYEGISRAVTTLVGNKTGERDIPAAKRSALLGTFYTLCFSGGFAALFLIIPGPIISVFSGQADTVARSIPILVIASFTMLPKSVNIVSGNAVRGYGDTMWMLATQVFGVFFVLSLTWAMIFPLGLGMRGAFYAFFLDETVRGIINTVRFYRGETSLFHKALDPGGPAEKAA